MIILSDMIDGEENLSKFRHIYETYKNTMYAVAYDISKNTYDAEDIVEDSFVKVIYILNDIASKDIDTSRCKNLMITITKNVALDYYRKSKRKAIPYKNIELHQVNKGAEELYIETENYQVLIDCINDLADKYKDVLRLKILNGLNSKTIGEILNISENGVNMQFMRAKRALARKLEEHKKNEC